MILMLKMKNLGASQTTLNLMLQVKFNPSIRGSWRQSPLTPLNPPLLPPADVTVCQVCNDTSIQPGELTLIPNTNDKPQIAAINSASDTAHLINQVDVRSSVSSLVTHSNPTCPTNTSTRKHSKKAKLSKSA